MKSGDNALHHEHDESWRFGIIWPASFEFTFVLLPCIFCDMTDFPFPSAPQVSRTNTDELLDTVDDFSDEYEDCYTGGGGQGGGRGGRGGARGGRGKSMDLITSLNAGN